MSTRELLLPAEAASFVAAGGRDIPQALAGSLSLREGEPLRVRLEAGGAAGQAIADPENGRLRLLVAPGEPFEAVDAELFAARVEGALRARRALGLVTRGAAYRLLNGAADGVPGLTADVLGDWAVLHAYGRGLLRPARELASVMIGGAELRGVVVKLRGRGAAARGRVSQELHGTPPPERLVVSEGELRFEVHLLGGLNVGLFTDMREQRRALARHARGRRVLNGFSYTGTLSVAAARGAAASVASIDLSAGVQRWARHNFRLNGFDRRDPRFAYEVADVGRRLAAAARDGRQYDLVLLDPPAFSAARGAAFAIDRDYPGLVAAACRVVPPGGLLWLACNARTSRLGELATRGLEAAGRRAVCLEQAGLPDDHPTLPAQPEDRYLQIALYRLE